MATSFITMDHEQGFWVNDAYTQVVCWGIVHSIDNLSESEFYWMKGNFREHLFHCSQGVFIGFINLGLDEYLINDERKIQMKRCIEKTKTFFRSKGDTIPVGELNAFQLVSETKVNWTKPLSITIPLKMLRYIDMIIDGKLTLGLGDEITWD